MVLQNSLVSADAIQGNGGNVSITAGQFLRSNTVINVSSEFGVAGTVLVSSPVTNIAGSLVGLTAAPNSDQAELEPACEHEVGQDQSSFIIVGNGGLPPVPGGWAPSFDFDSGGNSQTRPSR